MSTRRISEYGNIPMFPNILANGVNVDPIFSFYLNRLSLAQNVDVQNIKRHDTDSLFVDRENGEGIGGELVLGGVNPKYFKGDFEYVPTIHNHMWAIQMLR
ncbi:uncharacterized protein DC041_0000273 [Schistosoma bovis]|uniref:Peptidase A1 domain-containing protein n=1 Tax=Schistosoma bovis TaxID=6184 RepID=A0A430QDP3_SCHBO|nr:uncharacterized protein DC041_0000273 [Schistosoma bovis]